MFKKRKKYNEILNERTDLRLGMEHITELTVSALRGESRIPGVWGIREQLCAILAVSAGGDFARSIFIDTSGKFIEEPPTVDEETFDSHLDDDAIFDVMQEVERAIYLGKSSRLEVELAQIVQKQQGVISGMKKVMLQTLNWCPDCQGDKVVQVDSLVNPVVAETRNCKRCEHVVKVVTNG